MSGRVRVGYADGSRMLSEGHHTDANGLVTSVWRIGGMAPRVPSGGACGCRRERRPREDDVREWVVTLCPTHAAEPGVVTSCLS